MFFFLLWPLFARAPRHWFLENFLLSAPGVQSVFFLLRSVGRRDLSAGPEQKKNTTQGVLFFAPAPAKGKGRRSPVGSRHGARAKKNTTQGVFFFAPAPGKGRGRRSPVGRRHGARAKSLFFFGSGPVPAPNGASPSPKKTPWVVFFFLLWPRAGFQRGFSFPCLSPGPQQKKKTPWVVFLFLFWPRAGFQRGFSFPCLSPGPQQKKKNTLGGVFFFAAAPRGRSVTHCGPGWRCARTGVVFFFLLWPRPDAHSLTVGWGDFGKARVVFFVCCGPAGSF